ncbi:MAG TPA: tRNA guanosine(34) transglycosylase Tgt [Flexilinea sp.]|nr:tRNA guanosine(34) transglycosylase Tgt [Flexilinea sp.]
MTEPETEKSWLETPHGRLDYPVYLPDATYGMVRGVDAVDLEQAGVQGLVMNTFHLMQKPGSLTVQSLGGIHTMSGWSKPIITDSGGFQAYSLIRENAKFGKINENGITITPEGSKRKLLLSPEKTVQLQMAYGSDVVICLDQCTHPDDSDQVQRESVRRTIEWAKRCKHEFTKRLTHSEKDTKPPKIFGVVQGGNSFELRKTCADALLEIGFDGFGFGGWPLDGEGNLVEDILQYTRELIPAEYPLHALGIGHPENVVRTFRLGYDLFDCAMPTRDARHGRIYAFREDPPQLEGKWLRYLYIDDDKYIRLSQPLSPGCDCLTCTRYSTGYLHHLFKMNDSLYPRLATIHNIRILTRLTELLRCEKYGK